MLLASDYFESLFAAACAYVSHGWSVIPIWGDQQPDRAKIAAVPWTAYQHQRPIATELHSWFVERRYGGLAVITGRVSQLVVLDFDEHDLYARFQEQYPDLATTYTVQTRRGCHLYFRCLQSVPSHKAPGIDLQSDGRYVVAPPTVIDEHGYHGSNCTSSRILTTADVARIQAFFDAHSAGIPESKLCISVSVGFQQGVTGCLTPKDAVALYRSLAPRTGRNQALFQTSVRVRDLGWSQVAVQECLADVHAEQAAIGRHRGETEAQRRREAIATIESAFSRPARKLTNHNGQLPNSVREALLQMGQTSTLRVIEGLYLRGVRPGQVFTYAQAVHLLRGLVGQWSIRRALTALDPQGKPIFAPSPRTPTQATADIEVTEPQDKKCVLVSASKPTRQYKHPTNCRYFTLPGVYELCEKFGVQRTGSDNLTEGDLRSPRRYRQALHREYIRRRPGQYPRSWLASRLGVSIRSEQRYNLTLAIQVQPRYLERRISWWNLNEIPAGFEVAGTYLLDERGKRYPARQEIAAHLLAKRHMVIYRRQTTNFYSFSDMPLAPVPPAARPRQRELHAHAALPGTLDNARLSRCETRADNLLYALPPTIISILPSPMQPQPAVHTKVGQTTLVQKVARPSVTKHKSRRYYHRPLDDDQMERIAHQIHLQTNVHSGGMSLYNARRLVDTYGAEACDAALKRMVWLRHKGKIRNPAGFLVIGSRVVWRMQHGAMELGMLVPPFRGEPGRKVMRH